MIRFEKVKEFVTTLRGAGPVRHSRYAALLLALCGLVWSGVMLANTRQQDELSQGRLMDLRKAVSDLRTQVTRQHTATSTMASGPIDEPTAENLVARVGDAARMSGVRLAQSRVVASPVSAQIAAPAAPQAPAAQQGGQAPQAPPPVDPGGVEFHLTGSYAQLQQMLKALGETRARFQVVTLDVMRAKVAPKSGAAQLDIRLVCIL